jgi:hypothetical protein
MSDIYYWDKSFANKNNIDLEAIKIDIQKYGDNEKLDEDWEQIIYGSCQNDVYLKSKVFNILELFKRYYIFLLIIKKDIFIDPTFPYGIRFE